MLQAAPSATSEVLEAYRNATKVFMTKKHSILSDSLFHVKECRFIALMGLVAFHLL
jgi:hypothetical protein